MDLESKTSKKIREKKAHNKMNERVKYVAFMTKELEKAFHELKEGKFEEKKLFEFINRAIEDLKKNPLCGIRIPNKLIPKDYVKKYKINNLWKYNLPNAWHSNPLGHL